MVALVAMNGFAIFATKRRYRIQSCSRSRTVCCVAGQLFAARTPRGLHPDSVIRGSTSVKCTSKIAAGACRLPTSVHLLQIINNRQGQCRPRELETTKEKCRLGPSETMKSQMSSEENAAGCHPTMKAHNFSRWQGVLSCLPVIK